MPTEYVDLGYYTSRYMQTWGSGLLFRRTEDDYFLDLYDRIRVPLEAENGGDNWQVSRLFRWIDGNDRAFGFVVKHLDAGSPTGKEWFLWWVGLDSTDGWADGYLLWFDQTTLGAYFREHSRVDDTTPLARGALGIHYHAGGLDAAAVNSIEFTGNAVDGETLTIDGKTYTFQDTLTDVDGNVQIGALPADTVDNVRAAINLDSGAGTAYAASTTVHPTVSATDVDLPPTLEVTAKAIGIGGNAITVSETLTAARWLKTDTLYGGRSATTYDVGAGSNLDPPASEPHLSATDAANFMPDPALTPQARGALLTMDGFPQQESNRMLLVYNHEVPFIGSYLADQSSTVPNSIVLSGDLATPRVPWDVYRETTISFRVTAPDDLDTNFDGRLDDFYGIHTLDPDGNQALLQLFPESNATQEDQPRSDGDYDRRTLVLVGSNLDKGYVDPEVIAMQGVLSWQRQMTFPSAHGRAMKFHRSLVIPWVVGAPVPFFGWPLNPQTIPDRTG